MGQSIPITAIDGPRRLWRPSAPGAGRVCTYACERPRGRPVLLVHDLRIGSGAHQVRPLFECLRWRRPTYALDLPGYGSSDRGVAGCTPALLAAVLSELAARLRGSGATLDVVALGRGCAVAASVACDQPPLVRSLVLVEPHALVRPHATTWIETARSVALARLLGKRAPAAESALYRALEVPVLVVRDPRASDSSELEVFLRDRANRFAVHVPRDFEHRAETVAAMDRFWHSIDRAAWEQATR